MTTMIAAAAVMTLAVRVMPSRTAALLSPVRSTPEQAGTVTVLEDEYHAAECRAHGEQVHHDRLDR
jgi:hypothetical protein